MNTTLSVTHDLRADADAISAIREGDRDRYRELVERHAERVFAVAWCRLGDRDLAEEVTQETFIKGYRRLALLGKAERFGSWITAIARNAAINLGLRRRSELRKREQWALEAPAHEGSAVGDQGERAVTETLRETLAALPSIHRECLVLFYIEGKSISEAATALSLSETAFKTRLHRARAALREEMESRLEQDLHRLRPSATLVSAIMLGLPMGKPVWSLGGAIAVALSKLSPLTGVTFFLQLLQVGPAVATHYWIGKKEIENLRDRDGIRARNFIRIRNALISFFVVMIIFIAIMNHVMDLRRYCQVFAVLTLVGCLASARQLGISHHRNVLANLFGSMLLGFAFFGIGFLGWNFSTLFFFQGLFFLFMSVMIDARPLRADLSPFVAAQAGSGPDSSEEVSAAPARPAELFEFGQFLGARMMAIDWRRRADRLQLRLAPVTPMTCLSCVPVLWGDASMLTLHTSGHVEVHLGEKDRASLVALSPGAAVDRDLLEANVAKAAANAFDSMRKGELTLAERQLGIESESALYRVEPKKTTLARARTWGLRIVGVLMIVQGIVFFQMQRSIQSQVPRLIPPAQPVPVQETSPVEK
jgi:RNA polymerase sigma-70 factor (ECF subfamily)